MKEFAEAFYKAATEQPEVRQEHGKRLNQFLMSHDIDEWSTAFLDPSWTHEVIRLTEVRYFYIYTLALFSSFHPEIFLVSVETFG